MDRVFLDANILFSAAHQSDACLQTLWKLKGAKLITSQYALGEADRNLEKGERTERLHKLMASVEVVLEAPMGRELPEGVTLVEKDRPILLAAIQAHATHLLTGGKRHFGHLAGREVQGVLILPPADYMRR